MTGKSIALRMVQSLKSIAADLGRTPSKNEYYKHSGFDDSQVHIVFGSYVKLMQASLRAKDMEKEEDYTPSVLLFDIETTPCLVYVWGLGEQNVSLDQLHTDWSVLSVSAKLLGSKDIMYMDTRGKKDTRDDKEVLKFIWKLLDEADTVITQNGKRFDQKKLFARFKMHGMQRPSSFKHIDMLQESMRTFAFTSHKLEYKSRLPGRKFHKLKHKSFPGLEMWKECLKGNIKAFNEMREYNKMDVLALEEDYRELTPWTNSFNLNVFNGKPKDLCKCGGHYIKNGYDYSSTAKFERFRCVGCGHEVRGRENLFSKAKRRSLRAGVSR